MSIERFKFNRDEVGQVEALLDEVMARYDSVEDADFLNELEVWAHELPRRFRKELYRFKLEEPTSAMIVVSGFPVDDERIGDTPTHWKDRVHPSPTLREETMLMLSASLLGEPIGWGTQQSGFLVHDIMPIPGKEKEQLGAGSEELLWWHTEDAFHPYRGDYLGMFCLRNFDQVPTTFASMEGIRLSDEDKRVLFERHFTIRPDESHLMKNKPNGHQVDPILSEAYSKIDEMNTEPEKIAVMSGDPTSPYLRLDPYFMDRIHDEQAQAALDRFVEQVDRRIEDVPMGQGEFCFVDNFKGVHGRKPFKARYDGKDRWLKRVNVVRDLRKSRDARKSAADRVIV